MRLVRKFDSSKPLPIAIAAMTTRLAMPKRRSRFKGGSRLGGVVGMGRCWDDAGGLQVQGLPGGEGCAQAYECVLSFVSPGRTLTYIKHFSLRPRARSSMVPGGGIILKAG